MVIHINILTMAAPREDPHRDLEEDPPRDPRGDPPGRPVPAPRAIQLTVKYPSFNWEGNTHEQFKTFKQRTEILMEGPYEDYKEPDKVAAILGWLGDKGHQVYASLDWTALGKDKKKYQDVLDAFDSYFKPMQTIMHTWYLLGNIYSSQCKDQTEFMIRLKPELAALFVLSGGLHDVHSPRFISGVTPANHLKVSMAGTHACLSKGRMPDSNRIPPSV